MTQTTDRLELARADVLDAVRHWAQLPERARSSTGAEFALLQAVARLEEAEAKP